MRYFTLIGLAFSSISGCRSCVANEISDFTPESYPILIELFDQLLEVSLTFYMVEKLLFQVFDGAIIPVLLSRTLPSLLLTLRHEFVLAGDKAIVLKVAIEVVLS